jgi:hypothetical protein
MGLCILKSEFTMSPETFVQQLAEAAPSVVDLESRGLTNDEAMEFRKYYLCVKRDRPLTEPSGSDLVVELLRKWDLSKVEIGMVRFPGPHLESPGVICIGCVEADPLVLLPDGEIVVHELGTNKHLLWHVAKNSSALLEALVIAARFLAKGAVGKIELADYGAARSVASECASVAGGDKYSGFYKMLLGAE